MMIKATKDRTWSVRVYGIGIYIGYIIWMPMLGRDRIELKGVGG